MSINLNLVVPEGFKVVQTTKKLLDNTEVVEIEMIETQQHIKHRITQVALGDALRRREPKSEILQGVLEIKTILANRLQECQAEISEILEKL